MIVGRCCSRGYSKVISSFSCGFRSCVWDGGLVRVFGIWEMRGSGCCIVTGCECLRCC